MDEDFDWRTVEFPESIGHREARRLCRHFVVSLEGECYVSLSTQKHETFGERFQSAKPKTLEEVPLTPGDLKLSRAITRTTDLSNVEFAFSLEYDRRGDLYYNGMHLSVGVYDLDEMSSQDRELVRDVREAVKGYFEAKR